MDISYILLTIVFLVLLAVLKFGLPAAHKRGQASRDTEVKELQDANRGFGDVIAQLNATVYQLEQKVAESGEWIEVPVILHGLSWSNAAHTFVQLHSKTLELRASQMNRTVKSESYHFPGQPKPVLGGPKWQHIQGSRDQILLLGKVYTWG